MWPASGGLTKFMQALARTIRRAVRLFREIVQASGKNREKRWARITPDNPEKPRIIALSVIRNA